MNGEFQASSKAVNEGKKPSLDELIRRAKDKQAANEKARRESAHTNRYETEIKTLPITELRHFVNHLNYLFRTDAGQKWTNELTPENRYAFCFPSSEQFAFLTAPSPADRRAFKDRVSKDAERRARALGISKDAFCKTLIQARVDYQDSETKFTDMVEKDTVELLGAIEKEMPGKQLLCSVIHADQKDCMLHIHLLLCDKQEAGNAGEAKKEQ